MVDRRFRQDAVPEIEDVRPALHGGQDAVDALLQGLKSARPHAKVIVFVRGGGAHLHRLAAAGVGDALALDWTLDPAQVLPGLPASVASQGNLDPLALIAGGDPLNQGIDRILSAAKGRPHIFNLGHGILPETPVEHVAQLIARVRGA